MDIYKQLRSVQAELKAPKSQYNAFGKYKYRNAEDILEAVKPLCVKHGITLTVSDEVILMGDRFYVKAEVIVVNDSGEMVNTIGYAREEENKKGMDGSQVTGASSSYARKYALNGMFCIDDTKDSDSTNDHGKSAPASKSSSKPSPKAEGEKTTLDKAIEYMKGEKDRQKAYETVMKHYGEEFDEKAIAILKKFIR